MNYATIFPACRALVHHGGAGTTAAGLRAGVPALILWMADVQFMWGAALKRLKVGTARRFRPPTRSRWSQTCAGFLPRNTLPALARSAPE